MRGYTEGTNNKIKVIKRIAFGYKSFELFRGRILYIFNGKISGSIKHKNDSIVKKQQFDFLLQLSFLKRAKSNEKLRKKVE